MTDPKVYADAFLWLCGGAVLVCGAAAGLHLIRRLRR